MRSQQDTIAAIATAPGEAAISIVRLSGPESLPIADKIFRCKGPPPSRRAAGTFVLGSVWSDTGTTGKAERVDQVILLVYRAPNSYTRQDVVELQGHGGDSSARRILRAALDAGARPAEPGEFTLRAFLSGRIDLVQAEAVADLIRARTDLAASSALAQLTGSLSSSVAVCYNDVVQALALIEASLDFPEEDTPADAAPAALSLIARGAAGIQGLLATWNEGRVLREGLLVVISGRPNVGKSTLLNAVLGAERAIVHELPGTTRDTIEESLNFNGLPIRLVDTAGIRTTRSEVERLGIQRAQDALKQADAVLYIIDGSRRLSAADRSLLATLKQDRTIVVLNKKDLGITLRPKDFHGFRAVSVSLLSKEGMEAVRHELGELVRPMIAGEPHATVSERHRALLASAAASLGEAAAMLESSRPDRESLASVSIRTALDALTSITGQTYDNELLSRIFSNFCIGK